MTEFRSGDRQIFGKTGAIVTLPRAIDESEADHELKSLPQWTRDGEVIVFPTFTDAIRAVDEIALIAEELNHHPDIDIRWRTVRLAMTTHDVDGLSTLDIEAARRIDACIDAIAG